MIRRKTWYIIAVFAILSGITLYLQETKKLDPESAATVAPTAEIMIGQDAKIAGFSMVDASGKEIKISTGTDGLWKVDLPADAKPDQGTIEETISQLEAIHPLSTLSTPPPPASTGLDKPAYTLDITLKDGKTITWLIGSTTITASGRYTQISGHPVQIVEDYSLESVLNLFTSLTTPAAPTPTVILPTPTEIVPAVSISETAPVQETPASAGTAEATVTP
jgi:hypothetical protein